MSNGSAEPPTQDLRELNCALAALAVAGKVMLQYVLHLAPLEPARACCCGAEGARVVRAPARPSALGTLHLRPLSPLHCDH